MKRYCLIVFILLFCANINAHKWDFYPTYDNYVQYMQTIAQQHKDICKLDTIGTTYKGRLLLCMRISPQSNKDIKRPKCFYSAAMHGDELTGAIMLLRLIDTLVTNTEFTSNSSSFPLIYICPFANPDGTWYNGDSTVNNAIRYNANYIDLNRNYPDIRSGKNSDGEVIQKETQAFINYQLKEKFDISCNLHGGDEIFNYPWDSYTSYKKTHADNSWFKALGKDFLQKIDNDNDKYFQGLDGQNVIIGGDWYVIYGSRQDWSTYFAHCREVTLEVSMDKTPKENELNKFWHRLKNSLFVFFDYCNKGFECVVSDSLTSDVLENVMIEINNYDKDSSQIFTDNDGYCFRPILSGNYQVTFSKKGYQSKSVNIEVNDNLNKYKIQLVKNDVSIDTTAKNDIIIYPLPMQNEITIQSNKDLKYIIVDINGKNCDKGIIKSPLTSINTQKLNKGTYIIRMYCNNKQIINKKIIKQ